MAEELERQFHSILLKMESLPYAFGGRGYGGIDCSSLMVKAMRRVVRKRVADLPWMTADQLAKGHLDVTVPSALDRSPDACPLVFFDWDEDGIHEHAAVRLLDHSWMWASSTAGRVLRVDPASHSLWQRQWKEISASLACPRTAVRLVNWKRIYLP